MYYWKIIILSYSSWLHVSNVLVHAMIAPSNGWRQEAAIGAAEISVITLKIAIAMISEVKKRLIITSWEYHFWVTISLAFVIHWEIAVLRVVVANAMSQLIILGITVVSSILLLIVVISMKIQDASITNATI